MSRLWCGAVRCNRGLIGLDYEGRPVTVLICHVGVEGAQLTQAMQHPQAQEMEQTLRDKHQGACARRCLLVVRLAVCLPA
jgi:hypothetical protein